MAEGTSDEKLVRSVLSGDRGAFGELVERYEDMVLAVAYARVGTIEEARDVAQEAFLACHMSLGRLLDGSQFGRWLYGITRRQSVYWLRGRDRHAKGPEAKADGGGGEPDSGPHESVMAEERLKDIRTAIETLPVRYREVMVLRYFHGRSYEDIARFLGLTVSGVDTRMQRGRILLVERLDALGLGGGDEL